MSYSISLADEAAKNPDRLDRTTERRIRAKIRELAENPYDPRLSKRLEALEGLRSSRVGKRRILYTVNDAARILYVAGIRPRGEAYGSRLEAGGREQ